MPKYFTGPTVADVGGLYGINVEVLTGDKILVPYINEIYQYFDENGADRIITLDTASASAGNRFIVRHNGAYNDTHKLEVKQAAFVLDRIYAGAVKEFIFDGTNWISGETGTGESDTKKYNVAVGQYARAYSFGVAIGRNAIGNSNGVAVGFGTQSFSYGVAVGESAQGYSDGVAIGKEAWGLLKGVAIGREARAFRGAVSIGYKAGDNMDAALSPNRNILIGYQAGDILTIGDHNIIIGYDQDPPALDTDNFLNIGGVLYGLLDLGRIGIGVADPHSKLEVAGAISSETLTHSAAGPTDDLDVSGVNAIFIDAGANAVTIGGLVGGVRGQTLEIVIIDPTNNVTLEHIEGTGNQDFYLHAGADETIDAHYGGWNFICDGNNWYDASHARHV